MNLIYYLIIIIAIIIVLIVLFTKKGISTESGYFELVYDNDKTKEKYQVYATYAASFWSDKLINPHRITININDSSTVSSSDNYNVLASAYITRKTGRLPSAGVVTVNSTALARKTEKVKNNIFKHEFGHILGIGGEWIVTSQNDNPYISSDSYPNALAGYKESTGYTNGKGVPVENEYGAGSAHVHWEEEDRLNFGTAGETAPGMFDELMTAIIKSTSVLSKASLGFLKDLGWQVDMNKAESGILFSSSIKDGPDDLGPGDPSGDSFPFIKFFEVDEEGEKEFHCDCGKKHIV